MAMFLLVGCQTIQSAETETVPEVVKKATVLPEEEVKNNNGNYFEGIDIPPEQLVTSHKPIICGRIDVMLDRMKTRFGETPLFLGKVGVQDGSGAHEIVSTMTYNSKTGSYTFLEQMPSEKRLMCIISSGHGKINNLNLGTSL